MQPCVSFQCSINTRSTMRAYHVCILCLSDIYSYHLCHAVLSDAVPLVVSRQLLQQFTQDIKLKLPHDAHKEVAT